MTLGLVRYHGNGDLHYITTSCYQRRPLLASAVCRDPFLDVLEKMRARYQFVVLGYVVMPEHVHLLLSEPQERSSSVVIQALKLSFVQRFRNMPELVRAQENEYASDLPRRNSEMFRARFQFWQKRFYDFNVWTAKKKVEKLKYIHRNPVTRGLVESPELWRWSSFRSYAYQESGPVIVNDWSVLKMKGREL